jgi:hypothetical protein
MEINFYFSTEVKKNLTWEDRDTIEAWGEGEITSRGLRSLAARFMVNEKNEYLPHRQAMKELGKLTDDEITPVLERFATALQEASVPKANGTPSPSPSSVSSAAESLAGS